MFLYGELIIAEGTHHKSHESHVTLSNNDFLTLDIYTKYVCTSHHTLKTNVEEGAYFPDPTIIVDEEGQREREGGSILVLAQEHGRVWGLLCVAFFTEPYIKGWL